jgi:arabinofuranan 3-O-arabinosyltransferase
MATYEISPVHGAGAKLAHPVELVCFALIVVNVVSLVAFCMRGLWIVPAPDGTSNVADFAALWAAGRVTLAGHAAAAYDWPTLKPIEEGAVGHFDGYLGWRYPPPFLFAAAALALLPYVSAFLVWVFSTFVCYLAAIRAIIGDRVGYFLAVAFPAVLANFMTGQNGFLSASLIGGTLAFMEERPVCAGVLLGLLTYKPHLGLLFPIALVAGGHWRVFITAGIVAALMVAASVVAFGAESWHAFFPVIGDAMYSEGQAYWGRLQSAFGLVRLFRDSEVLAWTVQSMMAIIAAGTVGILWRSRAAYETKAAALGVGVLMATPHILTYDLVVLAVPIAFLFRLGRRQGFLKHELAGIGLACFLILVYPFAVAPVGYVAVLVVATLVLRRALMPAGLEDERGGGGAAIDAVLSS